MTSESGATSTVFRLVSRRRPARPCERTTTTCAVSAFTRRTWSADVAVRATFATYVDAPGGRSTPRTAFWLARFFGGEVVKDLASNVWSTCVHRVHTGLGQAAQRHGVIDRPGEQGHAVVV